MNGVIAELCAKTNSIPKRNNVIRIGTAHQCLWFQKNEMSSPTISTR